MRSSRTTSAPRRTRPTSAAALLALDATLRTNRRELPLAELYRVPTEDDRRTTTLEPGELLPRGRAPAAEASVYLKAMERKRWAFPLVGVAAARTGGATRVALAGVAPIPWLLDGQTSTTRHRCRGTRTSSTWPERSSSGRARSMRAARRQRRCRSSLRSSLALVAARAAAVEAAAQAPTHDANGCTDGRRAAADARRARSRRTARRRRRPTTSRSQTNCGSFTIRLAVKTSPTTTASFASLVPKGFFDHTIFHRIVPGFVIQGGDPTGTGTGGPGYTTVDKPPAGDALHARPRGDGEDAGRAGRHGRQPVLRRHRAGRAAAAATTPCSGKVVGRARRSSTGSASSAIRVDRAADRDRRDPEGDRRTSHVIAARRARRRRRRPGTAARSSASCCRPCSPRCAQTSVDGGRRRRRRAPRVEARRARASSSATTGSAAPARRCAAGSRRSATTSSTRSSSSPTGPSLDPRAVERVLEHRDDGAVVAASYDGTRSHPVVLARASGRRVPDEGGRALEPVLVDCSDLQPARATSTTPERTTSSGVPQRRELRLQLGRHRLG